MHATCPYTITPTRKGSDSIIIVQTCPCGYTAPAWDAKKGVK